MRVSIGVPASSCARNASAEPTPQHVMHKQPRIQTQGQLFYAYGSALSASSVSDNYVCFNGGTA